jgi:hypothetical protein
LQKQQPGFLPEPSFEPPRNRTYIHFNNSNKNLAPVVRTKRKYTEGMFKEHLNSKAYTQPTKDEDDASTKKPGV